MVDRGFREAVSTIEHFGYEAITPSFVNRKHQLDIHDASHNRLITKVRWVIESDIMLVFV